jgi:hypothetical protein
MSDAEERIKEIMERRKKEVQTKAHEQAWREDHMTEVVSKKSSAQYNTNARYDINPVGPSPFITTGAIKGSVTGGTLGALVDASCEQWLEKTQHMRVVALNEACEIAKTFIGHGEPMATREITSMASLFAKFLVDNEA